MKVSLEQLSSFISHIGKSVWPAKIIGMVLVFAFASKISDPFFLSHSYAAPSFGLSIVLDLTLGVMLVSSAEASILFLFGGIVFGLYFLIQVWLVLSHSAECSCFGNLPSNSGILAVFDFAASAYLLFTFNRSTRCTASPVEWRFASFLLAAIVLIPSTANILLSDGVTLNQSSLAFCTKTEESSWYQIKVRLRNPTSNQIRIVGAKRMCSVRPDESTVVVIDPSGEVDYRFSARGKPFQGFLRGELPVFVESSGVVKLTNLSFFAVTDK